MKSVRGVVRASKTSTMKWNNSYFMYFGWILANSVLLINLFRLWRRPCSEEWNDRVTNTIWNIQKHDAMYMDHLCAEERIHLTSIPTYGCADVREERLFLGLHRDSERTWRRVATPRWDAGCVAYCSQRLLPQRYLNFTLNPLPVDRVHSNSLFWAFHLLLYSIYDRGNH